MEWRRRRRTGQAKGGDPKSVVMAVGCSWDHVIHKTCLKMISVIFTPSKLIPALRPEQISRREQKSIVCEETPYLLTSVGLGRSKGGSAEGGRKTLRVTLVE